MTHPTLTPFEHKLFVQFAKKYKAGYGQTPQQIEGDGRIAVYQAGLRLIGKGVLTRHHSCTWYLTDLGEQMALAWQKEQA